MVEPVVKLHRRRDEEDNVRSYSIDEVIEGSSGFVTATRSGEEWSLEWEGVAAAGASVTEDEKQACIAAVTDHLDALAAAAAAAAAAAPTPASGGQARSRSRATPASGDAPATEPEPSRDSTEDSSG